MIDLLRIVDSKFEDIVSKVCQHVDNDRVRVDAIFKRVFSEQAADFGDLGSMKKNLEFLHSIYYKPNEEPCVLGEITDTELIELRQRMRQKYENIKNVYCKAVATPTSSQPVQALSTPSLISANSVQSLEILRKEFLIPTNTNDKSFFAPDDTLLIIGNCCSNLDINVGKNVKVVINPMTQNIRLRVGPEAYIEIGFCRNIKIYGRSDTVVDGQMHCSEIYLNDVRIDSNGIAKRNLKPEVQNGDNGCAVY